jgi:ABC-type glycerol-3-phosphate transport system permease component
VRNLGKILGLAVVFLWCIVPFLWMVMVSFQGSAALRDVNIFSGPFTTVHYQRVFEEVFMWNCDGRLSLGMSWARNRQAVPRPGMSIRRSNECK